MIYNLEIKTPALKNGFAAVHWAGRLLKEGLIMIYIIGAFVLVVLVAAALSLRKAICDAKRFDLWNKK